MRLTIGAALRLVGIGLFACLTLLTGASLFALNEARIGGTAFLQIKDSSDLTADILPPPLYVVEAQLWAKEIRADPATSALALEKLTGLHKDFNDRIAFWSGKQDLAPELAAKVKGELGPAGAAFWKVVDEELIPAVKAGDGASISSAGEHLDAAYARQRAAVDTLVPMLTARQAALTANTERLVSLSWVIIGLAFGLTLAGAAGGLYFLGRRVRRPIEAISAFMGRLAGGDYDRAPPFVERRDEIGDMARSVEVFREAVHERQAARLEQEESHARQERERQAHDSERQAADAARAEVVDSIASGLSRIAGGDLSVRLERPFAAEYEALRRDFNVAADALESLIDNIGAAVAGVDTGAHEIAQAADDLSRRTEQQAASLEETAAALEQLTATVRQAAGAAEEAHSFVSGASGTAERSAEVVNRAVAAMAEIEASSTQIGRIIGVIDEIAFQTNLLALNAGVEAARAGDAGRGFAVVASEVRALAQRSAEAAREIKDLISASSQQVQSGVGLVGETGRTLVGIAEQVASIDALVTRIAASTKEQSAGLGDVNQAVHQMDQMTQQNAAMVEESTAAAHTMRANTGALTEQVRAFQTGRSEGRRAA